MTSTIQTVSVPVGKDHTPTPMATSLRTPAQQAAVKAIMDSDRFDFFAFSPTDPATSPGYTGPFNVVWYRTDGKLMLTRIGTAGKVLRTIEAQ